MLNLAKIPQNMLEDPKQIESIKKGSLLKLEFSRQQAISDKVKYDYDDYYKKINDIK